MEDVQVVGLVQRPGRDTVDGIACEVEAPDTLAATHQGSSLQLGDAVVLQVQRQQTREELEGSFREAGEAVLVQVEVGQVRETWGV